MSESQDDAEADFIGQATQFAWDQWEKSGWLEALQKEFGPLNEKELAIFHDAWKLGFSHSMEMGRRVAQMIQENMPQPGKN